MCLSGGIGNCLPVQTEMFEMKSVNCGEALTTVSMERDEGNPQPSPKEILVRFRDYNHSVQTSNVVDDGIVQTTMTLSRSGKPGVVLRRAGFKIPYLHGCAGSIPAGGTIFYQPRFDNLKLGF